MGSSSQRAGERALPKDRGVVDVSIQMLFGFMAMLLSMLLIVETVAYWHARDVFDEAAAEGARVAAAFDGTCPQGVAAARAVVSHRAGGWGGHVDITCADGPTVVVMVSGSTPGLIAPALGFRARVAESAPKER